MQRKCYAQSDDVVLFPGCIAAWGLRCATTCTIGDEAAPLYGANDAPNFHAYLACTSTTVNCSIVQRAFDRWADSRHVAMDTVTPDNQAFYVGVPSPASERSVPYRLTMRYTPDLSAPANPLGGGSMPMMTSYFASVQVFDAQTGRLLKTMSFKDQAVVDRSGGAANPYINAMVASFLKHLDPTYAKTSAW